jgi:hypothetical protein
MEQQLLLKSKGPRAIGLEAKSTNAEGNGNFSEPVWIEWKRSGT